MARHELWTHGVNTIVEFPSRTTEIRHAGWGTLVSQVQNTDNWFHIPMPSLKMIDNKNAIMREIRLKAEVNENARVDLVHIREDRALIFSRVVSFTDTAIDEVFQRADFPIQGGVTLCIHISFLTGSPIGTAIFRSAGAAFLV
jgi:hypothetical protein